MRFWRRGVPQDPAADADTVPPEAEDAAPPPPSAEPAATAGDPAPAEADAQAEHEESGPLLGSLPPRTWFDRLLGVPETPGTAQPEAPPALEPAAEGEDRRGWFGRLRAGLSRSSTRLNEGINAILLRRRLDDAALEELEELLIASDMGMGLAEEVVASLRRTRFNQEVAPDDVRAALAEEVIKLVERVQKPLRLDPDKTPFVMLVVGVNGSGKTTTIGKLAKQYRDAGKAVIIAAGDTFRAAAVEQLQVWGERAGCPVLTRPTGSDAAGLAFDALAKAKAEGAELLLIDTAGRLHNKADLMGELQKIVRVVKKVDASAPHAVLLVLDATVGQNAHAQAEIFRDMVGVTGIVMTKLDGTAKGGVLVSLAEKYGIPIHAIGIGEGVEDLRPFDARSYARSLVGLEA
ncbi:MAG TPA: signal recognition particle-docking protein FtsY [Stellaceae bacterium]|nr:signal recognition particle-docking protein FtsY [Stellaceae bacterium]